jgi:hypothetical protein
MATTRQAIESGNELADAITNLKKFAREHQNELELRDIFNYDELTLGQFPCLSIVFQSAIPIPKSLGARCNLMNVNVSLFMYLESLNLGTQSLEHIARLGLLVKRLYENQRLYWLCHSEPMTITNSALVGRALTSDLILTAQVDVTVPIRFCAEIA